MANVFPIPDVAHDKILTQASGTASIQSNKTAATTIDTTDFILEGELNCELADDLIIPFQFKSSKQTARVCWQQVPR